MGFLEFQTVGFGQHRAAVDDIRLRDFQFDRKKEMSLVFGPRLFPSVPRCCLCKSENNRTLRTSSGKLRSE